MSGGFDHLTLGNPIGGGETSASSPNHTDGNANPQSSHSTVPGFGSGSGDLGERQNHSTQPPTSTAFGNNDTASSTTPLQPSLHHTWTSPTTFPTAASVAHQGAESNIHSSSRRPAPSDSEESSTPTLHGVPHERDVEHLHEGIPAGIGGMHGYPLPGSKADKGLTGMPEKDHQAAGIGGNTGSDVAAKAREELGIKQGENGALDDKAINEKAHQVIDTTAAGDGSRRLERTGSGYRATRHTKTAAGDDTVGGFGMVPVTRMTSQPPAASFFGGVAPSGIDAEEGLGPVRSREEEEEREAMRKEKGPDPWAVRFEPGEKINPKTWSEGFRWYLTGVAGLLVLNSTFASSSPSGIIEGMMKTFGFSQEVAILTISLFVAGYCVGPLFWGPMSESYGRRPMFIASFVVYTGFQVGCALSKNTGSILVFRFLGGCFAAAPLTNSGAMLADIWDTDHRGQAMSIFSLAPFAGPSIGPIVAGFITVTGTDWRWMYWILAIFAGVCLAIIIFTVPETYAPAILAVKAKKLRKETGEEKWYAPLEKGTGKSLGSRLNDILLKPFIMLALEPMLLAVTLYMSFVYGVVYLLFEAYPFVFVKNHGFNEGEEGLAFLGFFLGGLSCVIFFMTVIEPRYQRHAAKMAPLPPKPEKRLELCIISAWCMVIAMFWFGWTSYSSIHWISPCIAGGLLGVGVLGMFVSLFNYIIDVYLWAAASALAATTVMRSTFGAGFPLFATQMYAKLGTQWASSLLGFLALVMAPIPIVLTIFGPKLRKRSRYSPNKVDH